ncbi:MAG: bifunctional 4-hydroxy-2-oxoglutarate aldolase/2-dehydro-3-deoxy-phosphogluconate aldolase [Bacteroidota bacterium]|nr:bifunctional 4-hydroxy-2-oxoglutarate aldolase/2-dehydro-3-deoxy-phosphogluconate aldolase [Bacteroidota bacterium]
MTSLKYILQHKIVAILRGLSAADVINIATSLHEGGINIIEVTLNSNDALSLIKKLSYTFENKMLVGAGTVLTVKDARLAIDAGAQFLISPTLDTDIIKTAKDNSVVSIPGAYTPTEIFTAYKNGADIIKIFPAQSPGYVKQILAPLDKVLVMPTGGIDINNIEAYKKAGASAFGIGSSLVSNKEKVDELYLQNLTAKASRFVEAIK